MKGFSAVPSVWMNVSRLRAAHGTVLFWTLIWCALSAGAETDAPAPLEKYLVLSSTEDTALLDKALIEALGSATAPLNEATALKVAGYVAQVFGSGPPPAYYKTGAEVLLGAKDNLCGDKATLTAALCRRLGMAARTVAFYNFEALDAHLAVEVYYGGDWHFLDPTMGIFAYSKAEFDGTGHIPSRVELVNTPSWRKNLFFVGEKRLWSKAYSAAYDYVPLPRDFKKEEWQPLSLFETCQQLFAYAFPIPVDKDEAVSFPLMLHLPEGGGDGWIGKVDNSPGDCYPKVIDGITPRFSAIHFIGKGDALHVFHTLFLHLDAPGRYRLTYHYIDTYPESPLRFQALKDAHVISTKRLEKGWSCEFVTQSKEPVIVVRSPNHPAVLDAIQIEVLAAEGP